MKKKIKEKNVVKVKGFQGVLVSKIRNLKKKKLKSSSKNNLINKLSKKDKIVLNPEEIQVDLKPKSTQSLSKKVIKKYDQIVSINYTENEYDSDEILDLIKKSGDTSLKEVIFLEKKLNKLRYGLIFNVKEMKTVLIKGPDGDSIEAKDFRNFWGEKSELRRFEDGTIKEAVLWKTTNVKQSRRIIYNKINYILKKNLQINEADILYENLELENFITVNLPVFNIGSGEQIYNQFIQAKDKLELIIKNLDLKIKVSEFKCTAPLIRGTEVCIQPPLIKKFQYEHSRKKLNVLKATDLIINVNTDSKTWPQKLQPFRSIKLGFYIDVYDKLKELNLDNLDLKLNEDFLDIVYDNFLFRLKVFVPKELVLLKNSVYQKGKLIKKNLKELITLEKELELLPKISTVLQNLNSEDYNFGLACRLAKKWASTNFLLSSLNEIAIELIMFYIYNENKETYFIRLFILFLEFLYKFDWHNQPLIVNLNQDFTPDQIQSIEEKFKTERAQLPLMVICTPYDSTVSQWTKDPIDPILPVILGRILKLAKFAFEKICYKISESINNFEEIFSPPENVFDFKIILRKDCILNLAYQGNSKLKFDQESLKEIKKFHFICQACNVKGKVKPSFPLVTHLYPHKFLEILKETFGNYAVFFYNEFGGENIGVIWKPEALKPIQFNMNEMHYHKISEISDKDGTMLMEINVDEIIEDIQIIGGEIIKKIEK